MEWLALRCILIIWCRTAAEQLLCGEIEKGKGYPAYMRQEEERNELNKQVKGHMLWKSMDTLEQI